MRIREQPFRSLHVLGLPSMDRSVAGAPASVVGTGADLVLPPIGEHHLAPLSVPRAEADELQKCHHVRRFLFRRHVSAAGAYPMAATVGQVEFPFSVPPPELCFGAP